MQDWAIFRAFRRDRQAARAGLEVAEVRTRRQLHQFLQLPWRIYASDPHWVPPLLLDVKEFLDPRRHPFYRHGAATQFLATRDGAAVGRILVSDDPNYNAQRGVNLGCFGMFESIEDLAVARGLFEAAAAWLRGRGRTSMMGPIDYSTNYPAGLLIEGFDTPPRIMMNHHRPYYGALIEQCGLRKAKDLYAWWFDDPHDMLAAWRPRAERLARRGNVTVRPFRLKEFDAEVRRCKEVYNGSIGENWGFVRLTDAEFHYLAKRIAQMADPRQVLLAEIDGRTVGFSITLPDMNEAIGPLNGRLTTFGLPVGLLRLLYRARRVKAARMVVLGVLEGFRRRGVAEMLILHTLDYGKNTIGYTGAELGWTLEDNRLINRTVEAVGAKRYKIYRIYEKTIAQDPACP